MKLVQEEHMPVCQDAPHRNLAGVVVLQRFTVPFEFAVYFTWSYTRRSELRYLHQSHDEQVGS